MDIKTICYENYKLHWMQQHNHTLLEFFTSIIDYMDDFDPNRMANPDNLIEDWILNHGFDGNIWSDFETFLATKYLDNALIITLLTPEEYATYLEDSRELRRAERLKNLHIEPLTLIINNKEITLTENAATEYGEPQIWVGFTNDTILEITLESEGLQSADFRYTVRHHCSEIAFDNDAFHDTMGIINQFIYDTPLQLKQGLSWYLNTLATNNIVPVLDDIKDNRLIAKGIKSVK